MRIKGETMNCRAAPQGKGRARQRTEKLPPAAEGGAEGASSPPAPDKVKALFTGAVMKPELAPKSTLQGEGNLCPQSGLSQGRGERHAANFAGGEIFFARHARLNSFFAPSLLALKSRS